MSTTPDQPASKSDLQAAVQQLKEYIDERTHDAETRLLRAFSDYNNSTSIRLRKIEAVPATSTPPPHCASANSTAR
jgi:hypothetical protein